MGKIIGAVLGGGGQRSQADTTKQVAAQRHQERQMRDIANDRSRSEIQAEEARESRPRRPKRGRRLFVDQRSKVA